MALPRYGEPFFIFQIFDSPLNLILSFYLLLPCLTLFFFFAYPEASALCDERQVIGLGLHMLQFLIEEAYIIRKI